MGVMWRTMDRPMVHVWSWDSDSAVCWPARVGTWPSCTPPEGHLGPAIRCRWAPGIGRVGESRHTHDLVDRRISDFGASAGCICRDWASGSPGGSESTRTGRLRSASCPSRPFRRDRPTHPGRFWLFSSEWGLAGRMRDGEGRFGHMIPRRGGARVSGGW